jgi:fructose transport system substrate-binding protein
MRRPVLAAVAAVAVLSAGIGACGNNQKRVTVGLIVKRNTNPFWVTMKDTAAQTADDDNVRLLTAAGTSDIDNRSQVAALARMTAQGAKGIMITPANSTAIVPAIEKARRSGVTVIALDTPTQPRGAVNALYATNNEQAGELIGRYAKAKAQQRGIKPRIAMLDLAPGITSGELRHKGFLKGFGIRDGISKDDVILVSVDGGCDAIKNGVRPGVIDATAQQYPENMARLGVDALADSARGGAKPSGYKNTGVELITGDSARGVPSKNVAFGVRNCWG